MADVIICLGHKYNRYGRHIMSLRVQQAVHLYKERKAKHILFSGGRGTTRKPSEAQYMAFVAETLGVPRNAVLLEEKSTTTVGNAYYCLFILKKRKWRTAILVTDSFHMPRAKYLFTSIIERVRITAIESPAPIKGIRSVSHKVVEWYKLFWLVLRGIHFTKL